MAEPAVARRHHRGIRDDRSVAATARSPNCLRSPVAEKRKRRTSASSWKAAHIASSTSGHRAPGRVGAAIGVPARDGVHERIRARPRGASSSVATGCGRGGGRTPRAGPDAASPRRRSPGRGRSASCSRARSRGRCASRAGRDRRRRGCAASPRRARCASRPPGRATAGCCGDWRRGCRPAPARAAPAPRRSASWSTARRPRRPRPRRRPDRTRARPVPRRPRPRRLPHPSARLDGSREKR